MSLGIGVGIDKQQTPAAATPGAWSPLAFGADLLLWLDGQDADTLFEAADEVTPSADGQPVGRWKDKSGNNRHADQATAAAKPIRNNAGLNAHQAVMFDGGAGTAGTGQLLVAPTPVAGETTFEAWSVHDDPDGTSIVYETWAGGAVVNMAQLYINNGAGYEATAYGAGGAASIQSIVKDDQAHVIQHVVNTTIVSLASIVRIDGSGSGITQIDDDDLASATMGAVDLRIGARYDRSLGVTGPIGEVFFVRGSRSVEERAAALAYLRARWGTPTPLPRGTMTPNDALTWIAAHPLESWIALSGILNTLLRVRSASSWVALLERTRPGLAVTTLLRGYGFDPAGIIVLVVQLVSAKASGLALSAAMAQGNSSPPPRDDAPTGGQSGGVS